MLDVFIPLLLNLPPAINTFIGISLFLGVIMTALFYLCAYLSQSPTLSMVAKEELAALILSIVLVGAWSMLDGFISSASYGLICTAAPDSCQGLGNAINDAGMYQGHINIATGALEVLKVKLLTMYGSLYMFEVLIGFLSTISFPIGSFVPAVNIISLSIMPYDGLALLSNAHTVVVEGLGTLLAVIMAKQWLLIMIKETVPTIFLPFGLALRAVPIYRYTGSSVIAICIVLYFIYPISMMFSNYLIFDVFFKDQAIDFVYTPDHVGFGSSENVDPAEYDAKVTESQKQVKELLELFKNDDSVMLSVQESCGSGIFSLMCNLGNVIVTVVDAGVSFAKTTLHIATFMWTFAGDIWKSLLSPGIAFPSSTALGLYDFIMDEVSNVSQFIVVVTIMSVIEIIIAVTMYRNIALMIGGEVEIIGLSKLV